MEYTFLIFVIIFCCFFLKMIIVSDGQCRHKYQPRYDLVWPNNRQIEGRGNADYVNAFKNKIYVYDICVKCGHIVQRKDQA